MKAFCINLKEASARRAHCEKEFEREGLNVTFVRGFNGRESKLSHQKEWVSTQIGASISHYMVVEEIRHNNFGPALILEDDISLPRSFALKLRDAMRFLPSGWHVAALSWIVQKEKGYTAEWTSVNDYWQKFVKGDVWGQAAYLVNGSQGAERILECIHPLYSHIDRMFWENCRDGKLNGYFLKNELVIQGSQFESQNI
jgi:GR25 family glycosyltransferase involved in LPS biosynthesis